MSRFIDLSGQRFGRLVVTEESNPSDLPRGSSRGRMWLCRCDCGAGVWVYSSMLRGNGQKDGKGGTKSCGCLKRENGRAYLDKFSVPAPMKLPPGQAARRALFSRYARAARKRGIEWALPWEDFRELVILPCTYCGAVPSQREGKKAFNGQVTYNGLDRQDNAKGYTAVNVVPCCGPCNYMKRAMTVEEFLSHIRRIVSHQEAQHADSD